MTDPKDGPNKKPDAGKSGDRAAGDTAQSKRPFATIDLKAVEVPAGQAKPDADKAGSQANRPATGGPAAASGSAAATTAAASSSAQPAGQASAAQRVAAAAAASKASAGASVGASAAGAGASGSGIPATGARSGPQTARPDDADASRREAGKPPPAASAAAAPRRSSGSGFGRFVSYTLAALLGGGIAIGAAPYLTPQVQPLLHGLGLPTPPASQLPAEITSRIAALEKATAKPATGSNEDPALALDMAKAHSRRLAEIDGALGRLEDAQTQLKQQAAQIEARLGQAPASGDTAERLGKLEQQLGSLAAVATAQPDRAGRIPQIAQLTGKLADLEGAVGRRIDAVRQSVLKEVETRITPAVEGSEAARAGLQRQDRDIVTLKNEANQLATGVEQVKTATERLRLALKAAQDETAAVSTQLDGFRRDVDGRLKATARPGDVASAIAPLSSKVQALGQSLTDVVRSEAERKATAERIVLSLELGNLKRAMDRGAPYERELAEVKKVSGPDINLAPLEPYRSSGLATVNDLAVSFRPVANAILDADAEKADGSVLDRLLSGAKTFVRVRKTTAAAGDNSPEAIVARMETALKSGRLGDVLGEAKALKNLPPTATAWLDKVKARHTVEAALASIDTALKAALGAGPAPADQQPAAQQKVKP